MLAECRRLRQLAAWILRKAQREPRDIELAQKAVVGLGDGAAFAQMRMGHRLFDAQHGANGTRYSSKSRKISASLGMRQTSPG